MVPGSEVIADDGLSTLGQSGQRQEQHLHDGKQDGHGSHIIVIPVMLHSRVIRQLHQAFRGLHDERGRSQGQYRDQDRLFYLQIFFSDP